MGKEKCSSCNIPDPDSVSGGDSNIGDGSRSPKRETICTRCTGLSCIRCTGARKCRKDTMRYAFVLAEDGTPLMPTDIRHASHLLKRKEAVIAGHRPFTIRLTRHSEKNVQPVEVCCDAGYAHIGISVKSEKHEFVHQQYDNLSDEKKRHDDRRKYRRERRNRKRYRKPRFDNRKKEEGWIAPSLENRKDNHLHIIERYKSVCPVRQAVIEVGSFDTAAMKEYEETGTVLKGTDYQHGARYGLSTLRKAVLFRDGYTCHCCGKGIKDGAILRVHHIGYLKHDHSDRMNNLITVCTDCHTSANHKKGGRLYGWKPKTKSFSGAAFMNTVRWQLCRDLKAGCSNMTVKTTYGAETDDRRRCFNIEKTHANDAYVMGDFHPKHRQHEQTFTKQRRHNRILSKFYDAKYTDIRDGEVKSGQQLSCGRTSRSDSRHTEKDLRMYRGHKVRKGRCSIRTKQYAVRPNDKVCINGKWYVTAGVQNNGTRCKVGTKTFAIGKIVNIHHCGGWAETA